jgi:hypothetical protein
MTEQEEIDWCRGMFDRLAPGGVWGIPRSGMVFEKRDGALVLVAQMPHMPEMPITEEQLVEQQESEFNGVRENFGKAGVVVRR